MKLKSWFKTEQEASAYKEKNKLFGRVPELCGHRWALNFPLTCKITVIQPHSNDPKTPPPIHLEG